MIYFDYEEAQEYIQEIYKGQDVPREQEFIENSTTQDFDPIIEDEMARLFRLLLRLTNAKKVLEIGTSIGFSTTHLAMAVKENGGKVISLELDEDVARAARLNFERLGVSESIEIVIGNAEHTIKDFEDEAFDVVFQDSSKRVYPKMLDECLRVLKKGGLFLIDDTLFPVITPKDEWTVSDEAIDDFNRMLLEKRLISTILPIGEGCTLAVKT
ncbi:methyltransferase domain-containing protein [Candidatus Thorarchaeota archaeon]|nr:MAG: methyltransferase domain-containing protein [Candidatus Thorarchaeota archaeon]